MVIRCKIVCGANPRLCSGCILLSGALCFRRPLGRRKTDDYAEKLGYGFEECSAKYSECRKCDLLSCEENSAPAREG